MPCPRGDTSGARSRRVTVAKEDVGTGLEEGGGEGAGGQNQMMGASPQVCGQRTEYRVVWLSTELEICA